MVEELIEFDLQLFAEEDDIDIDPEEELEPEADEEELETEEEKPDDEEIEPKQKPDKVTNALIKQKQENKELKKKLAEYEQQEKQKEFDKKKKQIAEQYMEKGYDEEVAYKMADNNTKVEKLEREIGMLRFERQAERFENDYPQIMDDLPKLMDLCEKTGWTLKQVCAAQYGISASYDDKIKAEQEAAIKRQKANKAKPVVTGGTKLESVKLDPDDERAYQFYAKKNPGITRKQYLEKFNHEEKIPHDRWE